MIFECDIVHVCRRSRLGAWIEITSMVASNFALTVAPVWERGLKLPAQILDRASMRSLPFGSVD